MQLTIINGDLVRQLLPMAECMEVLRPAMVAASSGTISVPPRSFMPLMDNSGVLGVMPGASLELGSYGAKILSLHSENPLRGLPAIQGFVVLFDHASGSPVALVEGAEVTAIRTAAASGLATQLLAREDAQSCGIFGTGVQAVSHIDAMCAARQVREFVVWGRDAGKTRAFAEAQAERTGLVVRATEDPAEAGACDLVCTVTASPVPILLGAWIQPGAHINLVGSHTLTTREADTGAVRKSAVYVDLLESCKNEGGNIMIPVQEGAVEEGHVIGEIGQLLCGDIPGRTDEQQVTLYNSLGMTAQDLYSARHVYDKALEADLGVRVQF
jgi:ornithine cyclodeaminase